MFGRQTDREARFEVTGVAADELSAVVALVREVAGEAIAPQAKQEVVGRVVGQPETARAAVGSRRAARRPSRTARWLSEYAREAILQPLAGSEAGGARRPLAAGSRRRGELPCQVLAAIMVLEHWCERLPGCPISTNCAPDWGCRVLGPIDPRQQKAGGSAAGAARHGLSVRRAFRRGVGIGFPPGRRHSPFGRPCGSSAEAIIGRPSLAGGDEQLMAYAALARTEEDISQALAYIDQGRRAAEAKKQSSASWDLMELRFALPSATARKRCG